MTRQFDGRSFVRRWEAAAARQVTGQRVGASGSVVPDGRAMRRGLHDTDLRLDGHRRETGSRLRQDLKGPALQVVIRFGAMLVGTSGLIVAV